MTTGAARVNFDVTNLTQTVSTPLQGISFLQGKSVRGPIFTPDEVFNSWPRFSEKYGGLGDGLEAPLIIKRLLEKGGSIRFSRVANNAELSEASDVVNMTIPAEDEEDDDTIIELFKIVPKNPGKDYNNVVTTITAPTNGEEGYFNVVVTHLLEQNITETYENITIEGRPTIADSTYLSEIVEESRLIGIEYSDLSNIQLPGVQLLPDTITITFAGGTDGDELEITDFIGDSDDRTGFFAFDPYEDSYQISSLDKPEDPDFAIDVAAVAYCSNRKDMINYPFLPGKSKSTLLAQRAKLGDNKYQYIFGGAGRVINPRNSQVIDINPVGDIFAIISASDRNFGEWYSFAGPQRGIITDMLGVEPNFGSNASYKDLSDLANKQINMVIMRNGTPTLWGNFSGQVKDDQEKFISILRLIIFLKRSLRPTLETFLEEPNDIPTWKRIYYTVKPFLDSLVTNRALYSYKWQGDQDVTSMANLQINNPTDVGKGKYKVNLIIKAIPSIQEININIILAPTGLEFELVNELL